MCWNPVNLQIWINQYLHWIQWQILFSWASKSTADWDCSREIKRHLLLGRKAMTNLDSILKSRNITLPTKVCIVKPMIFPVIMYRCERWTIKKAECWKTEAFKLCWRRLLRDPWTVRRWNQSILKGISPEFHWKDWCWSWSCSTLAIWCEESIHWKRPWCWERLRAGGEGGDRGWDDWMTSLTQWTWVWANSRRWWRTEKPGMLQSLGSQRVGHDWVTEQLCNNKNNEKQVKETYSNMEIELASSLQYPHSPQVTLSHRLPPGGLSNRSLFTPSPALSTSPLPSGQAPVDRPEHCIKFQ